MSKKINVIIEIPKNSNIKYEYDRKNKEIIVDRILRDGFKYPANYGFVPQTIDWDGDELDVVVYSDQSFMPGVKISATIVGAMKMIDDGETDTKLIAIHSDDYHLQEIAKLDDLPQKWLQEVESFFNTYKNWKREGIVKISGFEGKEWALEELAETKELYQKYHELPKKEFIAKMMKKHPEKYLVDND